MGNHAHGGCPDRGNFRLQRLLVAGFSKGWDVTANEYRQKAERYLAYARRTKNQDTKRAILDRAIECIRLAQDTEPVQRITKRQQPRLD
jgi:hypothetical protein